VPVSANHHILSSGTAERQPTHLPCPLGRHVTRNDLEILRVSEAARYTQRHCWVMPVTAGSRYAGIDACAGSTLEKPGSAVITGI